MVRYQLKQSSPEYLRLSSYDFPFENGLISRNFRLFEEYVEQVIRSGQTPAKLYDVYYFHSNSFDYELGETNKSLIPRFRIFSLTQ